MRRTKKTLRRLSPISRDLAKIANDQASLNRRLHNLVQKVQLLELDSKALWAKKENLT